MVAAVWLVWGANSSSKTKVEWNLGKGRGHTPARISAYCWNRLITRGESLTVS